MSDEGLSIFDEPEDVRERVEERRELEDLPDARPERPPTGSTLTAFLARSAMVPAAVLTTETIGRSPAGKVDYGRLRKEATQRIDA